MTIDYNSTYGILDSLSKTIIFIS